MASAVVVQRDDTGRVADFAIRGRMTSTGAVTATAELYLGNSGKIPSVTSAWKPVHRFRTVNAKSDNKTMAQWAESHKSVNYHRKPNKAALQGASHAVCIPSPKTKPAVPVVMPELTRSQIDIRLAQLAALLMKQ